MNESYIDEVIADFDKRYGFELDPEMAAVIAILMTDLKDFISTALKEQERRIKEDIAAKIETYKNYYNPIGDEFNKGRHAAADAFKELFTPLPSSNE